MFGLLLLLITSFCVAGDQYVPLYDLFPASHSSKWRNNAQNSILSPENKILSDLDHAFKLFKSVFKREYKTLAEETKRFLIFCINAFQIMEHNKLYAEGKVLFRMAVNDFSDKTNNELKFLRGYKHSNERFWKSASKYIEYDAASVPSSIDWRDKGAVTPVKDQGDCGSCWAFSATGSLEGQHFRASDVLVSLSEQQLVDCSLSFGNYGCGGGLMNNAFDYLKSSGGIESEKSYPYTSGDTGDEGECKFKKSSVVAKVTGYVNIPSTDEEALKNAVASRGPISVAINASPYSFSMYHHGIYSDKDCDGDPMSLNHGVLVVGYGVLNGTDYWIVKNSWGSNWGEHGYIRILRNAHNMCGIATAASYPLV